MKKAIVISWLVFFGSANFIFAQSFHVNHLFSPGVTVGIDYPVASAINDSTDFQLVKYKTQFVKPLKTKFGVALKDFDINKADAKASQLFIATKFSVAKPSLTNYSFQEIYKGELEFTAITASIRNGIWIYSANVFAEESETSIKKYFTPNFRGYTAYINIRSLKFIHFYGVAVVFNQGRFLSLPMSGFRAKLTNKLKAEVIFPVHVKLNHDLSKTLSVDLVGFFSGINAVDRQGSIYQNNDNTLNFRELKTYLALNAKLAKHYKMKVETGYAFFRSIHSISNDYHQKVNSGTYFSLSLNYDFGNSIFGNFMDRAE